MFELNGKYNSCKVFTDNCDNETISQLTALLNQESVKDSRIRIMPDTHAGKGCVIGTTMTINDKIVPNLVGVDIGCFTGDTEVWCSAGFYKSIKELAERDKEYVMVDSYDEESNSFVITKATAFKTRENAELVAVTYVRESKFESQVASTTVRCTPDHKFLVALENTHKAHYNNDTLYWKEAEKLKKGERIWAEDEVLTVESVERLEEREDVYCLNVPEFHNFAIKFGAIVHNCGMRAIKLAEKHLDLPNLDSVVHKYIPAGFEIHEKAIATSGVADILAPINVDKAFKSLGTLGGGNHFIEIDMDKNGDYWLVIHTGSRHLGIEVCDYYQNLAYENLKLKEHNGKTIQELSRELVDEYTKAGRKKEISKALTKLRSDYKATHVTIPFELAYLEGKAMQDYLHDMKLAQEHAEINRETIAKQILKYAKLTEVESFDTIHNYIDVDNMILRKGSISAQKGEKVIIPMNMRDGSLICIGKGNSDWNYSAPHGAGRILSRSKAKDTISMTEYQESMKGIYTTSVNKGTIDESPMVYKPIEEIMENIKDTVEIVDIIKPVYNFKAGE